MNHLPLLIEDFFSFLFFFWENLFKQGRLKLVFTAKLIRILCGRRPCGKEIP